MERRRFIQLFAGLAVGALPGVRASASPPRRIGVVGGGILGSSIAYHLSRRGAEVLLFEKDRPAAGATEKSFAWVNATFSKQPRHYHELNRMSALAYRHLEAELGGALRVQWGGSLEWYGDPFRARNLRREVLRQQAWGYPTRLVELEQLRELEPSVVPGPVLAASLTEQEGSIDPVAATEALLAKASENGASVRYPCEVRGLDFRSGGLAGIRTSEGSFEVDVLVIAAGTATPALAVMAGLDVPLKDSPGVLAHTRPVAKAIERVVLAPEAHMKQKLDGRIVTGAGFGGAPITDTSPEQGEAILEKARAFLPALAGAELERVTLGWRPLPEDEYPIVGFSVGAPDVYLAVMHSGVTLAPLIGRLAAIEILDGVSVDRLSPYRLSRFESKS